MRNASPLLVISVLLFGASNLQGEPQCPWNVATVRYDSLGRSQVAIPVTINGSGPYEFIVDTGSQLTIMDSALASELRLEPEGSIDLTAVSSHGQAQLVMPDTVVAGSRSVSKLLVAFSSLDQIQAANPNVRGLLGENFLAHFDLLIDYRRKILCLDEDGLLRQALRGEHILLQAQPDRQSDLPFTQPYLVSAHLVGTGRQNSLLRLDSGAEVGLVYKDYKDVPSWIKNGQLVQGNPVGKAAQSFKKLAPEDLKIGNTWLRQVVFLTPGGASTEKAGQDGLLPTSMFHRVFLSYAEHFAMLDPK